jgi:hypothetical protein
VHCVCCCVFVVVCVCVCVCGMCVWCVCVCVSVSSQIQKQGAGSQTRKEVSRHPEPEIGVSSDAKLETIPDPDQTAQGTMKLFRVVFASVSQVSRHILRENFESAVDVKLENHPRSRSNDERLSRPCHRFHVIAYVKA